MDLEKKKKFQTHVIDDFGKQCPHFSPRHPHYSHLPCRPHCSLLPLSHRPHHSPLPSSRPHHSRLHQDRRISVSQALAWS